MMSVYCDESHDDYSYALAGWVAPPSAWDRFDPAWREMLSRFQLSDGSPVPGFHAVDIVCRDEISGSRFKGWSFDDERAIFRSAVDVITSEPLCANIWSVGCCVDIRRLKRDKDEIWHMLFGQLLMALIVRYPAQNGFSFMFDEKPEVMKIVANMYTDVKKAVDGFMPGKIAGTKVGFGNDNDTPPLQAADLLAYEWRRYVSERVSKPEKVMRMSYRRLRDCRADNSMLQYYNDAAMGQAIVRARENGYGDLLRSMWEQEFTRD